MEASLIVPAHNEEKTIYDVISKSRPYVSEVIVIDDASSDSTQKQAKRAGAQVIRNSKNRGSMESIKTGLLASKYDIIVIIDADGQHNPGDIPRLLKKIKKCDLVLGVRLFLPRLAEKLMAKKCGVEDATTGFRAFRKRALIDILEKESYWGADTVLRAQKEGLKVCQVPIDVKERVHGKTQSNLKIFLKSLLFLIKMYDKPSCF